MFTLVGYDQSVDTAGVLTLHAALPDPHVRIVGNDVIVPELKQLMYAYATGPSITQAQLQSPTLRRQTLFDIHPLDRAANPSSLPPFVSLIDNPIELATDEALNFAAAEDGAGAARQIGIVALGDGDLKIPAGDIYTVRVTSATAAIANAWTNVALTFGQVLPAGRYAVVGAQFFSTTLNAFRFVFAGGIWRPGGIGNQAVNHEAPPAQRFGGWGTWGEFEHNTPPTVDLLCTAADATQTGFLDLVKIK
jgi:hypothetical protein